MHAEQPAGNIFQDAVSIVGGLIIAHVIPALRTCMAINPLFTESRNKSPNKLNL